LRTSLFLSNKILIIKYLFQTFDDILFRIEKLYITQYEILTTRYITKQQLFKKINNKKKIWAITLLGQF
jgi:hypothetical protein